MSAFHSSGLARKDARRWPAAAPFVVVGGLAVIAAGLTSAATALAPSYHASWAVAYLVLVVGVAQVVLGLGQALLTPAPLPARGTALQAAVFNLGNAGVLSGSLLDLPAFTWAGSALLVVVLAWMYASVRGARGGGRLLLYAYRAVLAILFVSIPIGLLIALQGSS
ncbi:MAG TPA: hypothetical protein VF171_08655 [Trueperaceae bacterium]